MGRLVLFGGGRRQGCTTRQSGQRAEDLAVAYLQQQGYRIVERNRRSRAGEIDIIAWDGAVLCFIEVRSRANDHFGDPLESISLAKQRRIIRAARAYLDELSGPWPEMRFDAVGVLTGVQPRVRLERGAFEA